MNLQRKRLRADLMLLAVALIWGTTFVAQRQAAAQLGPLQFVALRFLLASLLLAPLAGLEARSRTEPLQRGDLAGALGIGLCLCTGCWLQQVGLETTSAGNAGFLTAVYIVLVPFGAWMATRVAPTRIVLAAATIALVGAWLLAGGDAGGWRGGDLVILASDFVWAAHITLVGHFARAGARPVFLAFVQCALTGLVSLPLALALEPVQAGAILAAAPSILYAGIVSSGIAFTLQITAQRHTPPAEAALILSLESVFAALAGHFLLGEQMTLVATAGAALILAGIVLVELGPLLHPSFLRGR